MRGVDRWVGFFFWFMECDLGYDGSLCVLVGKRLLEYSIRLFFFVVMGLICE